MLLKSEYRLQVFVLRHEGCCLVCACLRAWRREKIRFTVGREVKQFQAGNYRPSFVQHGRYATHCPCVTLCCLRRAEGVPKSLAVTRKQHKAPGGRKEGSQADATVRPRSRPRSVCSCCVSTVLTRACALKGRAILDIGADLFNVCLHCIDSAE